MPGGALRQALFLALLASFTLFGLCPFAHAQPVPALTSVPFTPPGTQTAVAISSLSPSSGPVGEPLILTVNGSGMSATSIVLWNGAALPTFYVSDSRLTAHVDSSLTASPGTATITVTDGITKSKGLPFHITIRNRAQP